MLDLRQFRFNLEKLVKEVNDRDSNWKWRIKSVTKNKVAIRWEYLDYCGETNPCFFIKGDENDEFITITDKDDKMIDGWFYNGKFKDGSVESVIRWAVEGIEEYAHSRY